VRSYIACTINAVTTNARLVHCELNAEPVPSVPFADVRKHVDFTIHRKYPREAGGRGNYVFPMHKVTLLAAALNAKECVGYSEQVAYVRAYMCVHNVRRSFTVGKYKVPNPAPAKHKLALADWEAPGNLFKTHYDNETIHPDFVELGVTEEAAKAAYKRYMPAIRDALKAANATARLPEDEVSE